MLTIQGHPNGSALSLPFGDSRLAGGYIGNKWVRTIIPIARPSDVIAYAAGDVIMNSATTTGLVYPAMTPQRVATKGISIRRLGVYKTDSNSGSLATFQIAVFDGAPGLAAGDNVAFGTWINNASGAVGMFKGLFSTALTGLALAGNGYFRQAPVDILCFASTVTLVLVTATAFTPTATDAWNFRIDYIQN
jgi:hypothetical protein